VEDMCVEAGGWWQNAENSPARALFPKTLIKCVAFLEP